MKFKKFINDSSREDFRDADADWEENLERMKENEAAIRSAKAAFSKLKSAKISVVKLEIGSTYVDDPNIILYKDKNMEIGVAFERDEDVTLYNRGKHNFDRITSVKKIEHLIPYIKKFMSQI